MASANDPTPCITCGACCAHFLVELRREELDGRLVLRDHIVWLTPYKLMMDGTGGCSPRCTALKGKIGSSTRCSVYDERPEACRAFQPSTAVERNPGCDEARAAHGLPPLYPRQATLSPKGARSR